MPFSSGPEEPSQLNRVEISLELPMAHLTVRGLMWNPQATRQLLCFHGWQDNAESFAKLAKLLPDYKFIALDLPGHGHSDHVAKGGAYDYNLWLRVTSEIMDALSPEPCIFIGHSMGGIIGSFLAAALPERFTALVLLDAVGPLPADLSKSPALLRQALLEFPSLLSQTERTYPSLEWLIDLRLMHTPMSRDSCAQIMLRNVKMDGKESVVSRADARIKSNSFMRVTEAQTRAMLGAIQCPTLIIKAAQNRYVSRELFLERCTAIPNHELVEINGDHHFHLDHPEIVSPLLTQFLAKLPAGLPAQP